MESEASSGTETHDRVSLETCEPRTNNRDNSLTDDSRDNSLTDDFSDEESICRSPAKSPKKAVRKLQLPRNGSAVSGASGPAVEDCSLQQQLNHLPTDADFQFKEPKFRKKKFIFHPFKRTADNTTCIPDPSQVVFDVINHCVVWGKSHECLFYVQKSSLKKLRRMFVLRFL